MNAFTSSTTVFSGIILCALLSACASGPLRMSASPAVPAAEGTVKTERSKNQNTKLEITVKHLAPPQKVASGFNTYVIWAAPRNGGAAQNLGAIIVDEDLNGKVQATTPFEDFSLFITLENSGQASSPTGPRVMWTEVSG